VKRKLLIMVTLCTQQTWAQTRLGVFVHKASTSNTSGYQTWLNNSSLNNKPNVILQVTQNFNPGGVGGTYNPHPISVKYGEGKWIIQNNDLADIPIGAAFNVEVLSAGSRAFIHHANPATNIFGNYTIIDKSTTNNSPKAYVHVIGLELYGRNPIGVWYTGSKWSIFNQDQMPMDPGVNGAYYHVKALSSSHSSSFVAKAPNNTGYSFYLNDSRINGRPNAILQVTPNWNPGGSGGVYNNDNIGVWYDNGARKWSIFNQNFVSMQSGAAFNVTILKQ
jgi:hypothetical protein